MPSIDKKQFGAFVAQLRKEKGYTQKELANKLFLSDKAVSKWETGASIPDTAILLPLAELLGVSVTELLLCRRVEQTPLEAGQVEQVVQTALSYQEKTERAYQKKSLWPVVYGCALLLGLVGTRLSEASEGLLTCEVLAAVFGAYFCFFVKTRLPAYYEEHRCGVYYDGSFHMNLPGVVFHNANWPHMIRAGRVWACLLLVLAPVLRLVMRRLTPALWAWLETPVFLVLILGGLFVPMYVLGKKYE